MRRLLLVLAGLLTVAAAGWSGTVPAVSAESAAPPVSVGMVGRVEVSPAPSADLNWSPREIRLRFPDAPTGVVVTLSTADGFALPPAAPIEVEGTLLRYPNPQIYAGSYTVSWDGPHAGSYSFSVNVNGSFESIGPSGETQPGTSAGSISAGSSSGAGPGLLLALVGVASGLMLVVLLRRRLVLAVLAMVAVGSGVFALGVLPSPSGDDRSACLPLSGEERLACLNNAVLASFNAGGVGAVVDGLHALEEDARFRSEYGENVCHTVAHMAAREVVAREGSISRVAKSADLLCASGFLHGAIEGGAPFVSTAVFTDEVLGICGEGTDNNSLECAHGIGHGAALRLNSRLPEAVDICLLLANEAQAVQCILGAAMLSGNWIGNMAARSTEPGEFTPPGLPSGVIGDVCLDEDVVAMPDRFRACLEGVFFYMKPGPEATSRLPAPWDSVDAIADWCVSVTADRQSLEASCFSGVGSASALRLQQDPATLASPCARANTDEAHGVCVESMVTQVRNNQDVSPPREVFETACGGAPERFRERCLLVAERLITR